MTEEFKPPGIIYWDLVSAKFPTPEIISTAAYQREIYPLDWMRHQLARYTYKPGWRFEIIGAGIGAFLQISMDVEDTYNPGNTVTVYGGTSLGFLLYSPVSEALFADVLAKAIHNLEIHEAREWLKRDGEIVDDPHKHQKRS